MYNKFEESVLQALLLVEQEPVRLKGPASNIDVRPTVVIECLKGKRCIREVGWLDANGQYRFARNDVLQYTCSQETFDALRVNMSETLSGIEFTEQGEKGFSG